MAEAFKACRTASQSISVASNGGGGSQEAADACSPRRQAIRCRHSAVDEGRGGRVVARHIEQLGRKKCHYLSTIDLKDTFHTLRLALSSQKYCGITPYYGSPTYHYLCMGMGMSVSSQIWQQFIDLVFQDNLIKCKQN